MITIKVKCGARVLETISRAIEISENRIETVHFVFNEIPFYIDSDCRIDDTSCSYCGDGVLTDPPEECDGGIGALGCEDVEVSLGVNYYSGSNTPGQGLSCDNANCLFDTSNYCMDF